METTRIAIIGAGAAGCFAAANIPWSPQREVVVFEKTGKVLQKVKVSGGGRCNTTHHLFAVADLIERYPRGKQFLRKTLHVFGPEHTISWFQQRGVRLKAESDGRMFPDTDSSQTIIDCIWQEMMKQKVQVRYHKSVVALSKAEEKFVIHFADQSSFIADRVLIACGGFPKPEQYQWLKNLGHKIELPVPSLFTFNLSGHPITELMGVAVSPVTVKIPGTKIVEQGPVLITHWGLSGPAVLRASAWGARELHDRQYNFQVVVNWLKDVTEANVRDHFQELRKTHGAQPVGGKNPFGLPRRLWEFLVVQSGINHNVRWGELPAKQQQYFLQHLVRHSFQVTGKTTFKEEFVTCGGISLSGIDAKTMQSKSVEGLYFAGEILDVDGITGGFNFQHAWSSAYIAARSLSRDEANS